MRPIRLEVRGFTAFREPAVVEFEGRRLFVITGPTGAGKSSLLDAMTWALFGQVPRVGRSIRELLAQGEREMSVMFDFAIRDQTYRVARRHPSTTSTRLERIVEGRAIPIADRANEVTREIERLLGMDYATFTRTILLPQGQFDSFLRGEAKDRRNILGQLIGLGVYQRAGEIARAQAAQLRTEADAVSRQLEQLSFATPEALAGLQAQEAPLLAQQEQVQARRTELQSLGDLARAEHGLREARERAEAELREIEAEVAATVTARDAAREATAAQERTVTEATASLAAIAYDRAHHDRLKAAVALFDQRASAEAALTTALGDVEATERSLKVSQAAAADGKAATEEAERHAEAVSAAEAAVAAVLARAAGDGTKVRTLLDAEATALEDEATTAEDEARRHEGQLLDLERLREALSASAAELACAATALAGARTQHAAQQKADEATRTAQQQAEARLGAAQHALDQARRDDAAAHLRSGLRIGDACPVCGEPITALADHVPADITAAEGVLALATADAREATSATERAIAALAGAAARVAEAERAHEAAEAQRGALSLRLTETGAAAIGIDDAIATARAAAADQVAIAAAKRTLARDHHVQSQAIREALARVPDTVEPSDGVEPPPAPPAVLTAIAGALRDHASAVEAARSAATALERTRSAAEAADRALDVARRDRERTRQTVTQAQERLAALGGAAGDEDATRRALVAVEEQARQVEELAAQIGKARETLASREAALAAAEQAVTRAEELRTLRQTTLAQTRSQWEAAEGELLAAWQRQFAEARPDLRVLKATMEECEADRVRIATELERVRWGIQQANAQIEQAGRMRDEVAVQRARADLVGAIGNDLRGDRFIAFLLHESMQMLAVDASDRLGQFTNGRYALKADEDEFAVIDHLNGDEERSVKTLSGGETFLASLALALSLSEHLPEIAGTGGAISLDSLFLDEGFGALDAEALDLAVQGLETLADGTRMIGVISHVEELAERLTDRIRVEKGPHGSTVAG